jgi:hypothetical protein
MSEDQFSRLEIRDKLEVLKKQIFVFFLKIKILFRKIIVLGELQNRFILENK